MATYSADVPNRTNLPSVKRIVWTAVFAGAIITLMVQFVLAVLGLGIGVSTIEPGGESQGQAFAVNATIWWVITALVSLFIGGWVAGRLSGLAVRLDTALHGFINWAVVSLATLVLLYTAVGSLIGGALNVVGQSVKVAGKSASALGATGDNHDAWTRIRNEALQLMNQSGSQEQPLSNQISGQPARTHEESKQSTQQADDDFFQLLSGVLRDPMSVGADRQALVNALVERTNLSEEEAGKAVDRWAANFKQMKQDVKEKAQQVAITTQKNVAQAAWWTFIALVLGATASACGGAFGSRMRGGRDEPTLA